MSNLDELAARERNEPSAPPPPMRWILDRARQRRRRRTIVGVGVVTTFLAAVSLAALTPLGDDHSEVDTVTSREPTPAPTPTTASPSDAPAPAVEVVPLGQSSGFVWPANHAYSSIDVLAATFVRTELHWPADTYVVSINDQAPSDGPTWVDIQRSDGDGSVRALAVPTAQGWGFVQIGDPPTLVRSGSRLRLPGAPPNASRASVDIVTRTGAAYRVPAPIEPEIELDTDLDLTETVSVMVRYLDENRNVITADAGSYGEATPAPPPTEPWIFDTEDPKVSVVFPSDPDNRFADKDQLVDAFAAVVLGWTPSDTVWSESTNPENLLDRLAIENTGSGQVIEVDASAFDGTWAITSIGSGLVYSSNLLGDHAVTQSPAPPDGATLARAVVRFDDGSTVTVWNDAADLADRLEVTMPPPLLPATALSTWIAFYDIDGNLLDAAGEATRRVMNAPSSATQDPQRLGWIRAAPRAAVPDIEVPEDLWIVYETLRQQTEASPLPNSFLLYDAPDGTVVGLMISTAGYVPIEMVGAIDTLDKRLDLLGCDLVSDSAGERMACRESLFEGIEDP